MDPRQAGSVVSYFDPRPRESDRERYEAAERRRKRFKLLRALSVVALVLVVLLIDFLQAKYVYHDMSCMYVRCVKAK